MNYGFLGVVLLCGLLFPAAASAHQPRLVEGTSTTVAQPEVSKAYYGELRGEPHVFHISSSKPFALYVNILVPDIVGQKKDVSALIVKKGVTTSPLAALSGPDFAWKPFFEPFGYDHYFMGPEYRGHVGPGAYEVLVSSNNNDSKYSLAIGETEAFDATEGLSALYLIPRIKRNFFNESPLNFILSPFGWGLLVAMYLFACISGFCIRLGMKYFFGRNTSRNLSPRARYWRLGAGVGLLLLAATTSWNPLAFYVSGYALFEALFGWSLVQSMGVKSV